jgi:hypothetical protein
MRAEFAGQAAPERLNDAERNLQAAQVRRRLAVAEEQEHPDVLRNRVELLQRSTDARPSYLGIHRSVLAQHLHESEPVKGGRCAVWHG